jgi:hypothetical protein
MRQRSADRRANLRITDDELIRFPEGGCGHPPYELRAKFIEGGRRHSVYGRSIERKKARIVSCNFPVLKYLRWRVGIARLIDSRAKESPLAYKELS